MRIFEIINTVTKDKRLNHSEVRVFMDLISYNSFKKIFPSLETISKDTGIRSIPDVSKKLHNLEKYGYIQIIRRKHLSNIYKINFQEMKKIEQKKPRKSKSIEKKLSETVIIQDNENNITEAFIYQIALIIASHRDEPAPGKQIYIFINRILNNYSDKNIKKYQIAFMLLHYILKAGREKYIGSLPYSYFNSFFPMLYYSDFRRQMFENERNLNINSDNLIILKNNIG